MRLYITNGVEGRYINTMQLYVISASVEIDSVLIAALLCTAHELLAIYCGLIMASCRFFPRLTKRQLHWYKIC